MTAEVKPEAFYDSLSIAHKLDDFLDAFQLEEIHLFSYFASILFLYDGKTPADWNYQYIIFNGYPHADDLALALLRHIQNGWLEKSGTDYYKISARGLDELNKFKNLSIFQKRESYLDAACTTSILMPYQETIKALISDPSVSSASAIGNQTLKQDLSSSKFEELSTAIGVPSGDLIIPSLGWIQYLLNKGID